MSQIIGFIKSLQNSIISFGFLEEVLIAIDVGWVLVLTGYLVVCFAWEKFSSFSKIWTVAVSVFVTGITAYLSLTKAGLGGKFFKGYYFTGWYVFVLSVVQFALIGTIYLTGFLTEKKEKIIQERQQKLKERQLLQSNVKKYFQNKNPFTFVETVKCKSQELSPKPADVNVDFIRSVISEAKTYGLSSNDKKLTEEAEALLFKSAGRSFTPEEKIRLTDVVVSLARCIERYSKKDAFTENG